MAITRRNLLGHVGGAYLASAMVAETNVADASMPAGAPLSADLARLIEAHRAAYDAMKAHGPILTAAETACFADPADESARLAEQVAAERFGDLCNGERAAFVALLSYPARDLDELRAIITVAKEAWWDHDSPEGEEFDALLVGIRGGTAE